MSTDTTPQTDDTTEDNTPEYIGDATYDPSDNKLRIRSWSRFGDDIKQRIQAAGFRWAPKQELWVAPAWTPEREDLCLELCGSIDDEDTTLFDRAEQREERWDGYRQNRERDAAKHLNAADAIADQIPMGQPILRGHHSERHARKHAKQIQRNMEHAADHWRRREYWVSRAGAAFGHARYKELPAVRARRIKELEKDERKYIKNILEYQDRIKKSWEGSEDPNAVKYCAKYERYIVHYQRWLDHTQNRLAYERAMLGEQGGIATDRVKPEKGGAVKCWAGPHYGKSWAIIQKVNKVTVTVLDTWGSEDSCFTRNVPFDKLQAVMSAAQVQELRDAGRLVMIGKRGFSVIGQPAEEETAPAPQPEPVEEPSQIAERLEELQEKVSQGLTQVVTVDAVDYFPTPELLADRVQIELDAEPQHRILEPSAGCGNLIKGLPTGAEVVAVEMHATLCEHLRQHTTADVRQADFLTLTPADLGTFDRIVMNPPFGTAADIKHICHAATFLKPGGRLVAICAAGPRQTTAFTDKEGFTFEPLPDGSFESVGTKVRTAIVTYDAPEAPKPEKRTLAPLAGQRELF